MRSFWIFLDITTSQGHHRRAIPLTKLSSVQHVQNLARDISHGDDPVLRSSAMCRPPPGLTIGAQAAVQHVYNWVHRDEDRSRARLEELGLPAPLAADVSNLPLEDVDQVYPEEVARIEDASEPATQSVAQLAPVQWDVQLKPQTIELDLD